MNNPVVSIIVPVYNASKTLRRCVDSVLKQEFPDFELLLVDDGSQDGSGAICDEYAALDHRVRVVHKENAGVSAARNDALDRAQGVFLQFLDSDDWITPDATKLLVRSAREHSCDMVVSDFYRVSGDRVSRRGEIDEEAVMSREDFASHMMENPADYYYGVLWNKLYRREIVETHRLRMDVNVRWCEDFLFNLEYILRAKTFFALRAPIYYYVKTKGSLVSQSLSIPNIIRMKLGVFEYYNRFYKHVLDDRSRKLMERYLEVAALKHDLSIPEVRLLLCLRSAGDVSSRKELADFAGISRVVLALSLQRLSARDLLRVEETREKGEAPGASRRLHITLLPAAQAVLEDGADAVADYDRARFSGFSSEERRLYAVLSARIQKNMEQSLQ